MNQAFLEHQFFQVQGSNRALVMKKSKLDLHKMLWFKDTIQLR
jgi:hypothetical protein